MFCKIRKINRGVAKVRKTAHVEVGAVQSVANLVELQNSCKIKDLVSKIGFDITENGPSKIWVTGVSVYRHTGTGIPVYLYSHCPCQYIVHHDCAEWEGEQARITSPNNV